MSDVLVPDRQSKFFYGYILAAYSFLMGFFASCFFLHTRGIFFPIWMEEFGVARTEISLVISLVLFTSSCVAPIIGFIIDKFPLKLVICFGACWLTIGYFLLQFVDGYYEFFFTLLIFQGIGWGCVGPLTQTKLMVNWFTRNRGLALGIAIMGISVAGVVMPTVATWLSLNLGWRNTYTLYASILVLLIVPMTLWVVKQSPSVLGQYPDGDDGAEEPGKETAETEQSNVEIYREFITSKAFWSVVLTFGLMNGVFSAMITHLPAYLTTELDFTLYDASYVLGVAGGFAIAGKILFGWMMDRMDAKKTVLLAVTSYFSSTLVFMSVDTYLAMMLAAALFGLGFGGMVPVRSVLISRLFGVKKFSRVNGLLSFFLAPATFWVLITGYIADTYGSYTYAFQVWAVAFLLAGVVTVLIRLPNREEAVA